MAKKRTFVPFYGKINQRLEQCAKMLTAAGGKENMETAVALRKQSEKILALRRAGK